MSDAALEAWAQLAATNTTAHEHEWVAMYPPAGGDLTFECRLCGVWDD